jgi:NAD(P)H dehydrogenase (quinone)
VAAAVLTGEGHDYHTYDVTGPERLGAAELAALLDVPVAPVSDAGMTAHLVAGGLPPARAELVTLWQRSIREGHFAPCTTAVADLTGRPATPVAELLSRD